MRFPPWKLDMDPRDHHDELEALERTLALDRTEPVDLTDRLERLLEADMDEMPARSECEGLRSRGIVGLNYLEVR